MLLAFDSRYQLVNAYCEPRPIGLIACKHNSKIPSRLKAGVVIDVLKGYRQNEHPYKLSLRLLNRQT